jgi:hypothetical protein
MRQSIDINNHCRFSKKKLSYYTILLFFVNKSSSAGIRPQLPFF